MEKFTLQRRLLVSFLAVCFFRIGSNIPIPGLDTSRLEDFFLLNKDSFGLLEVLFGGTLTRLSLFSLGVIPYITSTIFLQMLSILWEPLRVLKKSGTSGNDKISMYTRYFAFFLALVQSVGIASYTSVATIQIDFVYYVLVVVTLVSGTMILMCVGDIVTKYGIGNGVSLIIFSGIVALLLPFVGTMLDRIKTGDVSFFWFFAFLVFFVFFVFFIVFMEQSIRYIVVNYASRQKGRRLYAAQRNTLPLKINMSGVMGPIFASSVILFPVTIFQWLELSENSSLYFFSRVLMDSIGPGTYGYILVYLFSVIFFCFLYTSLVFNSTDVAVNLKKAGAFLTGYRPGTQTATYISFVVLRLTVLGALYIAVVSVIPEIFIRIFNVPFYLGGTSILILVVVAIELISSTQTHMLTGKYKKITENSGFSYL